MGELKKIPVQLEVECHVTLVKEGRPAGVWALQRCTDSAVPGKNISSSILKILRNIYKQLRGEQPDFQPNNSAKSSPNDHITHNERAKQQIGYFMFFFVWIINTSFTA